MAEGVRSTNGILLLSKKDVKQGLRALKFADEPLPFVQIEIVNRDYLLEDVNFNTPQELKKHYKVRFSAADLKHITDWSIRGRRLAAF